MTLSINLGKDGLKYRPENGKVYFTYRDVESLPEWPESPLIELTGGELFVVPSPSIMHQKISGNFYYVLSKIVREKDLGSIFSAPTDVKLSDEDLVIPDLLFISNERKHIIKEKFIEGPPDLVVEILSSNEKRDKEEKFKLYQLYGVKEYLIIDPINETINQYVLDNKGTFEEVISNNSSKLTLITLENAQISYSEIFS